MTIHTAFGVDSRSASAPEDSTRVSLPPLPRPPHQFPRARVENVTNLLSVLTHQTAYAVIYSVVTDALAVIYEVEAAIAAGLLLSPEDMQVFARLLRRLAQVYRNFGWALPALFQRWSHLGPF